MQRGKAPGPDGFPIELHIEFSSKLVPILKHLYNEILSTLPETLSQATNSVLLKRQRSLGLRFLLPNQSIVQFI